MLPPTDKYEDIPDQTKWNLDPNASYVHICTNETIHGNDILSLSNKPITAL